MASDRIRRLYRAVLRLYPKAFRAQFGMPMEQAFMDLLADPKNSVDRSAKVLLWVFAETLAGAVLQRWVTILPSPMESHRRAALAAFLLALPMGVLFSGIVFEIAWLETAMKSVLTSDGSQPNAYGFAYMLVSLAALPFALAVSVRPMLRKSADGRRRVFLANLLVAAVILALMTPTYGGLAKDLYRCEVLKVKNCD